MTIDVSALAPEARAHYRILGERVTTRDTLAQADMTILAFVRFGVEVSDNGYGLEDHTHLSDTRDTLLQRHTDRSDAMGASQLAGVTYSVALRGAKDERMCVRTLLNTCVTPLRDTGKLQDAQRVESLLKQTSAAPDDGALLDHMKRLHVMVNEPVLAPLIAGRGGPGIIARLQSARDSLLLAIRVHAANPEVSAVSEERNILDGIIVVNTRNAYAAARVAARRLGQPAIANAFKLVHLRKTRNAPVEDVDPGDDQDEPDTDPSE
jgi:hypothetical protein